MNISPQIETIPDPRVYAEHTSGYAGIPDGESPYAPGPAEREDPPVESPGGFAEILAGLLRGAGSAESEAAVDAGPDGPVVPPAETAEAAAGELGAASGGGSKSRRVKPAAAEEPVQAGPGGPEDAIEAELAELDLSEEDQNILLGVELLLNRSAEQIPRDGEEAAPAGESAAAIAGFSGEIETAAMAAASADEPAPAGEDPVPERPHGAAEDPPRSAETPLATAGLAAAGQGAEPAEPAGARKNGAEKESRGREGPGRLEEVRSRRRDRPALEVRDLRGAGGRSLEGGPTTGELPVSAGTREPGGAGTREITLELRLPNQGQNAPTAETAWEVKAGQAVENLLARELHQSFNNDIVRHASMLLRDEGAGTIRLALKPETLGNVKIRLEMAENKITGHIVVESEEALRAFEREVHSLEQAFKESGFETANLEMSLAGNGGGAEQDWREAGSFLPGQMIASQYDAALERTETSPTVIDVYRLGPAAINVLA